MPEETSDRPLTFLDLAYRQFRLIHPDPLTPRGLAAMMRIEIKVAYNYIHRLKVHNVIRPTRHSNPARPEYELVPGTAGPPPDGRGKRNPKASRPISQFTDKASRRVHILR